VASYFCNELNMDWRLGAAYFESQLIDYDACSNWEIGPTSRVVMIENTVILISRNKLRITIKTVFLEIYG
jgi:hypothetical protein